MKYGLSWQILVVLCAILVLAGCSESSLSSRDIDADTYLFFSPHDQFGTQLYGLTAVDPNTPTSLIPFGAMPSATFLPVSFRAGTVNSASSTISGLHYRYVVYSDGTNLFRVSALRSEGLTTSRISNEAGAATICPTDTDNTYSWGFTDYSNPLNSLFIYRQDPDASGCVTTPGNDTMSVVQLNSSSSTVPTSTVVTVAEEPVAPVYNADGSINSLLLYSSLTGTGYFNRRTTSLGFIESFGTNYTSKPSVVGIDGTGRIMLAVYGAWGIEIRVFDSATLTLSAALHTSAAGTIPAFYASDGTYGYFHDGRTIYRAPFDASAPATVVADETGTFTGGLINAAWDNGFTTTRVQDIHLSGNNLVYIYDDSSGATPAGTSNTVYVRSVPKTGGTPATIHTFPNNAELLAWRAAAGRIYLSRFDVKEAVSVGDVGQSPTVFSNSWWMGFTFHSNARLFSEFTTERFGKGRDLQPKTIFRAQYDLATGNLPAQLISYDADTTEQLIDFGVPAPTFGSFNLGGPPDILGLTTRERTLIVYDSANFGSDLSSDILYLHARNSTSMVVASRNSTYNASLVGLNNGGGCSLGRGRFDPIFPIMLALATLYLWRRRKYWRIQ